MQQGTLPPIPVKIMMNIGNPQLAFEFQSLPNAGVGLARLEFIINNKIGVHPKAVLDYPEPGCRTEAGGRRLSRTGIRVPRAFFEAKLAEGISTIAAAFWPKPVIVRMSDFKSNEYKKLIGGSRYEPDEENPMLGFRGAARYIADSFRECFRMEASGAEARARRNGTHQRRNHGAVRAHADRGEARHRTARSERPEARQRVAVDGWGPARHHDVRSSIQCDARRASFSSTSTASRSAPTT